MLVENPQGNYSFVKGISPYSAGAVAARGYEIEHARLWPALPLARGFHVVERHLESVGRSKHALCAMELRIPEPFSFKGFADFNAGYVKVLEGWGLLQQGLNPVARTNVAPAVHRFSEPMLHAFSYTVPSRHSGPTFVVAGAGELPEGSLDPHDVVRRGETSQEALAEKMRFVMDRMEGRLREMKVDWGQVSTSEIYTVHEICPLLVKAVLERMGAASRQGVTWHYAQPPIVSIEYEMDLRGCLAGDPGFGVSMEWRAANGKRLRLTVGDITSVPADAIVNAANSALRGGGGVDGAIHRAGGAGIMRELDRIRKKIGNCPTGSAVVTEAGALPAKFVFHVVGPIYDDGSHGEADQLAACYRKCLELAEERSVEVISFPSISTGAYGYPVRPAAEVAVKEVRRHLQRDEGHVQEVIFVLFDQKTHDAYAAALK